MIEITQQMHATSPATPILIQANAGLPVMENDKMFYKETPEYMASLVERLVAAGAKMIGGCCGTNPDHIRAIACEVKRLAAAAGTKS
jgi:5-methyltetrahydrofolate--homocysteine methyltransferase